MTANAATADLFTATERTVDDVLPVLRGSSPLRGAADLFGLPPIGDIPDDVARGLAALAAGAPIWPVGVDEWAAIVTSVRAFAAVHDAAARHHGFTSQGLYGLSRLAPWSDVSRMGAGWFVARSGHRVAGIEQLGILLIGAGGGRLRLYRTAPDEHVVLAWQLVRAS